MAHLEEALVGKGQSQKQEILAVLTKNRGAAMSVSDIAVQVELSPQQVLTLLGQLKGEVECVSRATMESTVSMKWEDVDSKWRLAGTGAAKEPVKWPPRPGSVPFGSETAAELGERLKRKRINPERVVLAAYLGHSGAREALAPKAPAEVADLAAWFVGLARWKEETRVRGLAAGARRALAVLEAASPGEERPRRAVEAALAWSKSQKSDDARLATGTALGAEEAAKALPEGPARAAATAAYRLGILVSAVAAKKAASELERLVREVAASLAVALPESDLRAAVRDELGPWALS